MAAGALYGSDMVYLREADNGAIRILFEHFGPAPLESAPFTLDRTREHVFEIEWASFAPDRFGAATEGEVVVRVNGEDALRTRSAFHDFPDEHPALGRNPFGTTCAPQFRGWVVEAAWRER